MPGVSDTHDCHYNVNIIYLFMSCLDRLRFTPLRTAELRVQVSPSRYVYPDLTVVRGRPAYFADRSEYNLINPYVVLEVTSPSSIGS